MRENTVIKMMDKSLNASRSPISCVFLKMGQDPERDGVTNNPEHQAHAGKHQHLNRVPFVQPAVGNGPPARF